MPITYGWRSPGFRVASAFIFALVPSYIVWFDSSTSAPAFVAISRKRWADAMYGVKFSGFGGKLNAVPPHVATVCATPRSLTWKIVEIVPGVWPGVRYIVIV